MFSTCVFVLEEMSNVAAALKLHFFPRVWNTFKHRERRASFRREKNTRRERKRERESFISLSSIARIKSILVREKSARRSRPKSLFGEINRERIESHREE